MDISRRTVIGAGAALPLVAAIPASAAASGPSPSDWADLNASMRGSVALPGSSAYTSRAKLFDPRFDVRRPAAVARPVSNEDIAKCVAFARDHGLQTNGRSGGHSYVGASARNGSLVIDTRSLGTITLSPDGSTTTVRAGANLYSVHEKISAHGRSIPTGTCPTVGAVGLTLCGGLGVDSRRHGLTIDSLVSATVVDGTGRIRTVDASHDKDLFWALRGGGSGAAIVADMTYRTIPARSMGFFSVTFPASSAARVVHLWGEWMAQHPRDTWANLHLDTAGSSLSVRVFGATTPGLEATRAASLRSAVGVTPLKTTTTRKSHMDAVRYLGGGSTTPRTRFAAGSDILRTMPGSAAQAVVAAMRSAASRGLTASAILDPLDGAAGDPAMTATACPWRNHVASIQWYVGVASASGYSSAFDWIGVAHDHLAAYTRGGYIGYLETGHSLQHWLAGNSTRRAEIHQRYDPDLVIG